MELFVGDESIKRAIRESIAYGQPVRDISILGEELEPASTEIDPHSGDNACMLSGGVDSSLVACMLAEVGEVTAYTLTFGKETDEAVYAKKVAEILGIEHVEIRNTTEEFIGNYEEISTFQPHARPAYWAVMGAVKEDGYDKLYSGEGGDELFLGYVTRYERIRRYQRWKAVRPLLGLGTFLPGKYGRYAWIMSRRTWAEFMAANDTKVKDMYYPEGFKELWHQDCIVSSMRWDYLKLRHYVDTINRMSRESGVKAVFPIMANEFLPEKWREYRWKEHCGKKPLVRRLKEYSPEIAKIATREKQGFRPPGIRERWRAGMGQRIMSDLRDSPIRSLASRELDLAIEKGPDNDMQRRALTEMYTINRFLTHRG